jgi:hypothetical protein
MANEHEPRSPEGEGPIVVPTQALVPDQLVDSLVPDPSQPPTPTVSLLGLLGRSAKENYWRLYFSTSLKRYAEFKEEDVLHSVKVPRALPPFVGMEATRVWIRADAEIEYTRHESRRVQAKVLQGGLAARSPIDEPDPTFSPVQGGLAAFTPIDPPDGTERLLWTPIDPPDGAELLLRFMPSVPKPIPEPI